MKNKIRLAIGWFGVLTPVYAAGVLSVLLAAGNVDTAFIGRIILVATVNLIIGFKLLRSMVKEKGVKKYGRSAIRS